MKALLVAAAIAQALDATTTAVGIHRGCREMNPIFGDSIARVVAVKSGLGVAVVFARGKFKVGLSVSLLASGAAATSWNLSQLPRCHR